MNFTDNGLEPEPGAEWGLLVTLLAIIALLLTGCASAPTPSAVITSGNAARLMALPDAKVARKEAPVFTEQALLTVVGLESELMEERTRK